MSSKEEDERLAAVIYLGFAMGAICHYWLNWYWLCGMLALTGWAEASTAVRKYREIRERLKELEPEFDSMLDEFDKHSQIESTAFSLGMTKFLTHIFIHALHAVPLKLMLDNANL